MLSENWNLKAKLGPIAVPSLDALEAILGHTFKDEELLQVALTHRSRAANNYERLEFLGDSILGFVIAEQLYQRYPEETEGKLSRMRASLVRKETLAQLSKKLGLGEYLRLGEGELKSGGFQRASILADVFESVIGALYLDAGLAQAREFIERNFADLLQDISPARTFKDPKSRLQEAMQKRSMSLPDYKIVATSGVQHKQNFTVLCQLNELPHSATANASTRRLAEQKAAELVLKQLLAAESV